MCVASSTGYAIVFCSISSPVEVAANEIDHFDIVVISMTQSPLEPNSLARSYSDRRCNGLVIRFGVKLK